VVRFEKVNNFSRVMKWILKSTCPILKK
jgi:hypothetical protein